LQGLCLSKKHLLLLAFSLIGMFFIEKFDRRTLLIGMGILNVLSLTFYVIFDRLTFYVSDVWRYGCVASIIGYGISYGFALGPLAFSITSELVSQRFRFLVI
jgi:hypothetical protein